MIFDVNGEYGYELFAALPLINWYHEAGHDVIVKSAKGAGLLYPNIRVDEIYKSREPFLRVHIDNQQYYRQHNHVAGCFSRPIVGDKLMWEDKWSPPNLKEHYKGMFQMFFDKPIVVVSNKYQMEWNSNPVNYLDISTLSRIFEILSDKFYIVYNRPGLTDIVNDHSTQLTFGDRDLVFQSGITTMQDLAEEYNLDYNTTQMLVMSRANHHISTQGGNSALAAYFGGENIIYGIKGYEVKWNAYETFFPKLSGQTIHHVTSYDELINKVKTYVK